MAGLIVGVFTEDNLLPAGLHRQEIATTNRYGRRFSGVLMFEMIEALRRMSRQAELFE
ncbi:hypothetical protein [Algihabitans sp.]|uniref:hypothetical protein n=1 Tax=Algihabitans sp. TaxID=2821514 RepID=UPI003BA91C45